MKKIATYLKQRYRPETVIYYQREIKRYLQHTPLSETANYADVMHYIGILRQQRCRITRIQGALQAIKQYYHYLLKTGKRKGHPCRCLTLKDKPGRDIQLQDLFTEKELDILLSRKEHYKILEKRNKLLIGLLIHQGLTTNEITQLKIKDVNLEAGTLHVSSTTYTNSRTIGLKPSQIMVLYDYIENIYPKLLSKNKKQKKENNKITSESPLILTWRGTQETGEGISYLISTYKKKFPGRNLNPRTIRQSVITNLLKQGKDIRIVQEYVGHKSPDTTEKYKQSKVEELQAEINKYHPLK
jgi:integrase/recombinase XerD